MAAMRSLLLFLAATALIAADAKRPQVDIITSLGTIRCTLFADEAPEAVANFIALAEGTKPWKDPRSEEQVTKPFFDGLTFHRVIAGFMIQGGCPLGEGTSGPGYAFKDEINATSLGLDKEFVLHGDQLHPQCGYMGDQFSHFVVRPLMEAQGISAQSTPAQQQAAIAAIMPVLQTTSLKAFYEKLGYIYDDGLPPSHRPVKGSLALANSGPATNGSQFFINLEDTPHLTGKHTVFGEVSSGQDVVAAIGSVAVDGRSKPLQTVTIVSIRLVKPAAE